MRRHLCAIPRDPVLATVERWRRRWDPGMASIVPAHITVVYPEETADEALLLSRAARFVCSTTPFRLRLCEVVAEDGGRGGVFISVHDVDGGWEALRRRLLAVPMKSAGWPAHLTVVHPRTSSQGARCFAALAGQRLDVDLHVGEIFYTETDASSFTVVQRFPMRSTTS